MMHKIFAAAAITACGLLGAGEIDFSRELPRYKASAPQKALLDKEIKVAGADSVKLVTVQRFSRPSNWKKILITNLLFMLKGRI